MLRQRILAYQGRIVQAKRTQVLGWEGYVRELEDELVKLKAQLAEVVDATNLRAVPTVAAIAVTGGYQLMPLTQQRGVLLKWQDPDKRQDE